ncbi:hypothetical protein HIM_10741 [Hirsutella minnesotensis 3608]|uniref:Uncharacterized protein n=1 Tax=Hirsutella minnesotensis 3608 TaxID=1043627 RepID=A0A0F7ZX02_9HYPO|nr:hypothetical protein HIM_10741 [Hirsutella minnesotensis 3608]
MPDDSLPENIVAHLHIRKHITDICTFRAFSAAEHVYIQDRVEALKREIETTKVLFQAITSVTTSGRLQFLGFEPECLLRLARFYDCQLIERAEWLKCYTTFHEFAEEVGFDSILRSMLKACFRRINET